MNVSTDLEMFFNTAGTYRAWRPNLNSRCEMSMEKRQRLSRVRPAGRQKVKGDEAVDISRWPRGNFNFAHYLCFGGER